MLNNLTLKKGIIWFWAAWWVIALWTDLIGVAAHFGSLKATWAPDLNYPFLAGSLKMYNAPEWLIMTLFFGIILWSAICTIFFVRASLHTFGKSQKWMRYAETAFIVSIAYWLGFFLADQIVMKFDLEENHMVQGGFLFLTYLGMYLLPNDKK